MVCIGYRSWLLDDLGNGLSQSLSFIRLLTNRHHWVSGILGGHRRFRRERREIGNALHRGHRGHRGHREGSGTESFSVDIFASGRERREIGKTSHRGHGGHRGGSGTESFSGDMFASGRERRGIGNASHRDHRGGSQGQGEQDARNRESRLSFLCARFSPGNHVSTALSRNAIPEFG
jgi:hypothetical protein